MAHYHSATNADRLSDLVDRAPAGEDIVITREGRPAVELRVVRQPAERPTRAEAMERSR